MTNYWEITLTNNAKMAINVREFWSNMGLAKKLIAKIRQNHGFQINNKTVYASDLIQPSEKTTVVIKEDYFDYLSNYDLPKDRVKLDVVYENEDVLVIDKTANMKMHPHSPHEDDTLLNYVNLYLKQNNVYSRNHLANAYMVHRIDRATSGLVLIAKNPIVVPILNKQLANKTMSRKYIALVEGIIKEDSGVIDKPLKAIENDPLYRQEVNPKGLSAKTSWKKLATENDKTLLELTLFTGRTHQIRVHTQSMGHPIIGDELYGNVNNSELCLHAYQLSFKKPFNNEKVKLESNKQFTIDSDD